MENEDKSRLFSKVRKGSEYLHSSSLEERNEALLLVHDALLENRASIFAENRKDIEKSRAELSPSTLRRLVFDEKKLDSVLKGIKDLIGLKDPKGRILDKRELDDGLILERVTYPIGVIAMIFEARPDALCQIASLSLKSGNGIILKGGKEAKHTNRALFETISSSLKNTEIGKDWILLLETREDVRLMLQRDKDIDLVIPRGSNEFVRYVMDNTRIPVIGHSSGVCSVYVDKSADLKKAVDIAVDSKTEYPAVCNAAENIIVHRDIASDFLPLLRDEFEKRGVTMHSDKRAIEYTSGIPLKEEDLSNEYLDLECNVIIADSLDEAIEHINEYGSHHTDAIVAEDEASQKAFIDRVDSADVFVNASTRFADGYRFGLGAEVGISTGKIHSRGPVGLEGLMTYKWILRGNGDIVEPYNRKEGAKSFKHRDIL